MSQRVAFASGFAVASLLYLFPACGGGADGGSAAPTSIATSPVGDTADHYLPALFAHDSHGVITTLDGSLFSEWRATPGTIVWGDDSERESIQVCQGIQYAVTEGYGTPSLGLFYRVAAVINRVNGVDLALPCPTLPGVFMPLNLPASGETNLEQWFNIYHADGTFARHGFWRARLTTGQSMQNPCWAGAGSNTRPVVKLEEVYFDESAGWVRGAPLQTGALPWVNGVPVPIATAFANANYLGRDAGHLWRGNEGGTELCLRAA